MKRAYAGVLILLACVLLLIFSGCGTSPATSSGKQPFSIGAIFDITGSSSSLGIPERDSVRMLVDQTNAKGGINGHKINLIMLDGKSSESETALAMKRLVEQDKVLAVIGSSTSGPSMSMVPIAQDKKVPMISSAASIKIIEPIADRKWVFKTAQNDTLVAKKISSYLKSQGITNIAFMLMNNTFGESGLVEFEKVAKADGLTIVTTQKFEPSDTNMTTQLTKVKGFNPGAVVVWATPPSASNLTKGYRQLGLTIPLIHSHGIGNKAFIDQAGESANGVVFPIGKLLVAEDLPTTDPQQSAVLQYAKDYESKFKAPRSTFGGHGWDAMALLLSALAKTGDNPTPAALRDELEKINGFKGISGVFNLSDKDHNGLDESALVMVKISGGKWQLVK